MHRQAVTTHGTSACEPSSAEAAPILQILLVAADPDLREVGARALARQGYTVRVAPHSGHAVLAGLIWRVDVLIAELSAPDISGPALAQILRQYHPALRAVFMANPGTPEGLDGVVVRPFTRDDLTARIRAVVTSPPPAF